MMNLVELQGSEKQIAWAEDIRQEYVEKLETFIALWSKKLAGEKLDSNESGKLSACERVLFKTNVHAERYEEIYADVWNAEFEANTPNHGLGRGYIGMTRNPEVIAFRKAHREEMRAYEEMKKQVYVDFVKAEVEKDLQNPSAKFWIEEKRVF